MTKEISPLSLDELNVGWNDPLTLVFTMSHVFETAYSLQETLSVILTAITAGMGLGFNRAMLFLVEDDWLKGKLWLGPADPAEAGRIWSELDNQSKDLQALVNFNKSHLFNSNNALNRRVRGLKFELYGDDPTQIPTSALINRRLIWFRRAGNAAEVAPGFLETLQADEFICAPLISRNKPVGAIVVDNAITQQPINERSLALLAIACPLAAVAIENANLVEETIRKAQALEDAVFQVRQQQDRVLRMEKLSAMGQVMAIVSHEVRNPLSAIGGFARTLIRDSEPSPEHRRYLEIIRDEVGRLEQILHTLPSYLAKDDPDKKLVPVDVGRIAARLLDLFSNRIREQGVVVSNRVPIGCDVLGLDELLVDRCLLNVLQNALDAMATGGTLVVEAETKGNSVAILVSDTGIGISPEARADLFTPFFTTKSRGLGLGLAFVKETMTRSGGSVNIESSQGGGTVVALRFQGAPELVEDAQ